MSHPGVGTAGGDAEHSISETSAFSSRASQDIGDASYYVDRGQEQEMEAFLEAWCEEVASAARLFAAQELPHNLPPSESDPQLSLPESRPGIPNTSLSHSQEQHPSKTPSQATWLPPTLRWPFLMVLFCATLALGILTIALSVKSAQNKGLCNNSGSLAFSFTWRFLPTLIAVIYALMVQVLTNDVKRTEAFAKLSKPKGSSAASTLLLVAGPWWKDPFEALRKKRNDGHRSWTLFWVSITNIMAILLVSPLSAGLLSLDDVQISEKQPFNRLQPFPTGAHGSPLKLQDTATDETYFRTISSVVQNLTTSAWLNDTHAVLPFWPAGFDSVPFGASLAGTPQQWKGQTSVFQAGLECTPMNMTSMNRSNIQSTLEMESEDGCSINLTLGQFTEWPLGGGWWSNTTAPNYPTTNIMDPTLIIRNNTSGCGTREMFFFAKPFDSPQTNQSMAQLCSSDYFIAYNVTTTVENTAVSSLVRFDEIGFNQTKVALDHSLIDLQNFEELFLSSRWNAYFRLPQDHHFTTRPLLGGPLILLAALLGAIDLNSNTTFEGVDLPYHAQKVKQRFFGEALQAAFASTSKQNVQQVSAQVTTTQTRLVVSYDIGIALGSILIFSAAMINIVCYCSRTSQ
ncbi:MAG: hypothetical protein LQ347_004658 [Umbilicaria vellea]|nr:MAG: hypothetical protein LQ347_004658 [Umbilicaria vellea]